MKIARPLACAAVAAVVSPLCAFAGDGATVRTLEAQLSAGGTGTVRVDAPVGGLRLEGGDGDQVRAVIRVLCDRPVRPACRQKAEAITLRTGGDDEDVEIDVEGWPKGGNDGLSLDMVVTLPARLDVDAELGVGELRVTGVEGALDVELGVGEVTVEMPEGAARRVDLEVGVGEAVLYVAGRRVDGKGFLGKQISWSHGGGGSDVDVECGVGEIEVRLTD